MTNAVTATYANEAYDPLRNWLKAMQRDDALMDGPEVQMAKQLLLAMERQIDGTTALLQPAQLAAIRTRHPQLVKGAAQ